MVIQDGQGLFDGNIVIEHSSLEDLPGIISVIILLHGKDCLLVNVVLEATYWSAVGQLDLSPAVP